MISQSQPAVSVSTTQKMGRIDALDVLRAFILLGILIVHTNGGFGLYEPDTATGLTVKFHELCHIMLSNKCNIAFTTMFGVSFALILKNKNRSSLQFIWRSILLIGFGVVNKFFFWYDALMWYGIIGIIITPFRYLSNRVLVVSIIAVYLFSIFVWPMLGMGKLLFGDWQKSPDPDILTATLGSIMGRPLGVGIKTYFYYIIPGGGFLQAFSFVGLGYLLGRSGVIYRLAAFMEWKWLILLWTLTLPAIVWQYMIYTGGWLEQLKSIVNPLACYTYCYTILFLFYKFNPAKDAMMKLAPYGRMSLTNYSLQADLSVCILVLLHTNLTNSSPLLFIGYVGTLFGLQAIFSWWWMKYMNFGPMEWIWRCLTRFQFIPLLKKRN